MEEQVKRWKEVCLEEVHNDGEMEGELTNVGPRDQEKVNLREDREREV